MVSRSDGGVGCRVPVLLLGCLGLIPAHRLANRFGQERRVIAIRLGVLAVIDDVRGIVNLIHRQGVKLADSTYRRITRDVLAESRGLGGHLHARYRVPNREPLSEHRTVPFCAKVMTAQAKVLTNRSVGSQKTLSVAP